MAAAAAVTDSLIRPTAGVAGDGVDPTRDRLDVLSDSRFGDSLHTDLFASPDLLSILMNEDSSRVLPHNSNDLLAFGSLSSIDPVSSYDIDFFGSASTNESFSHYTPLLQSSLHAQSTKSNSFQFDSSFSSMFALSTPDPLFLNQFEFGNSISPVGDFSLIADTRVANESTMSSELEFLFQELTNTSSAFQDDGDKDSKWKPELMSSETHSSMLSSSHRRIPIDESTPVVTMIAPMMLDNSVVSTTAYIGSAPPSSQPSIATARKVGKNKKRVSLGAAAKSKSEGDNGALSESEGHLLLGGAHELAGKGNEVGSPANLAFEVFSQAAIKASNRRRTVEEAISCVSCSAKIGVLELRGTPASFEAVYVAAIRCRACCEELNESQQSDASVLQLSNTAIAPIDAELSATDQQQAIQPNRKRRAGPQSSTSVDEILSCQVCKRISAQGSVKKRSPIQSDVATSNAFSWTTPDFAVSLICDSCFTKYLFCSECGGGGKTRTGKYRPRALFPANRRTCSLPHIRIGTTRVSHRVLEAPLVGAAAAAIVEGVRDVFFDCLVSLYAVPGVLEGLGEDLAGGSGGATTLARIRDDVERLWTSTVRDAIVSDNPNGLGGGKIYVTVAWIEKRNRNKGKFGSKKKKDDDEPPIPWLVRLAMEGTVAPLKAVDIAAGVAAAGILGGEGSASSTSGSITRMNGQDPAGEEEKTYVSFSVSEWDRARGALFVLQMAPRSVYLPTMESYGDLLRRNIERVQADSRRDNAPPLEHVWCWTRELSHSRLRSIPERLGFVQLEQYMRENAGLDRQTFERDGYLPLQEEGVSVHVTSVKALLSLLNKRR
ncbi:hypothetical protein HDU84_002886 [Entophlyctis sp. JEL0112]|nr:hypothetical protein HDU84_002886 [Entophlyctis sp. JEL0112]